MNFVAVYVTPYSRNFCVHSRIPLQIKLFSGDFFSSLPILDNWVNMIWRSKKKKDNKTEQPGSHQPEPLKLNFKA